MRKNLDMINNLNFDEPSPRDKFLAFMFGIDDAIEREIMRYVYESRRCVNFNQLIITFVYKNEWCSIGRLHSRLDSLVKFGFLNKFEYRGTVFYEIPVDEKDLNKKEI